MRTQSKIRGYLLGALGAAAYGTNPLFAKPLYADGMNPVSVLFFRYLMAIPIVYIMLHVRGRDIRVENRKDFMPFVILGVVMAVSSLSLFMSYTYMPAGIASTILFIYPIMVAVIMALLFNEKTSFATILCIAASTVGIFLLYRSEDGTTLDLLGTILVIISAASYAIYIVGINKTALNRLPTLLTTFYIVAVCDICYLVYALATGGIHTPGHWYSWLCILALAVFPTVISFTCTTVAIQSVGSTPTAILGALEPATAIIIGMAVFDEEMTGRIATGLVLIILSVMFVIGSGENSPNYLNRLKKMFPKVRR
ncbi:MAG: DMT family transporter [Paludibacteraceae bacterium]|nr:DMT family transporter [Paludibacteraceae bacterium]